MAQTIGGHPGFVDTRTPEALKDNAPKVPVFVRALGLHGVEIRASMWTETIATNFATCSDVRKALLEKFRESDIEIAEFKLPCKK